MEDTMVSGLSLRLLLPLINQIRPTQRPVIVKAEHPLQMATLVATNRNGNKRVPTRKRRIGRDLDQVQSLDPRTGPLHRKPMANQSPGAPSSERAADFALLASR